AAATSKWVDMDPAAMMDHWLDAYDIVRRDIDHLHALITIRSEDLVADPTAALARLAAFLDVETVPAPSDIRNGNQDYAGTTTLSPAQAERASAWGYAAGLQAQPWAGVTRHPLRRIAENVEAATGGAPST
ncbi:MAG TPA: sulfotransferase, partial [Sulfitobacter sp.]|nr:sulfotransferase [Sulfitobacter sp.]